ncbi:hypothetical protein Vafri_20782, partial [Volvox africanus]
DQQSGGPLADQPTRESVDVRQQFLSAVQSHADLTSGAEAHTGTLILYPPRGGSWGHTAASGGCAADVAANSASDPAGCAFQIPPETVSTAAAVAAEGSGKSLWRPLLQRMSTAARSGSTAASPRFGVPSPTALPRTSQLSPARHFSASQRGPPLPPVLPPPASPSASRHHDIGDTATDLTFRSGDDVSTERAPGVEAVTREYYTRISGATVWTTRGSEPRSPARTTLTATVTAAP